MINLFIEFFKIGLLAIGGGYATIPFLFHLIKNYNWFTPDELTNMIAIANVTPGPVGINMATYTGYTAKGILGSLITTFGIILGPFIVTLIVIYFINKFKNTNFLKEIFENLKPTAAALLTVVLIQLITKNIFNNNIFNLKALLITAILFLIYPYFKKFPSLIILFGGILGIIFNIF